QSSRRRGMGRSHAVGGFLGGNSGDALLHVDLPHDRSTLVHGDGARGAGEGGRGVRHRRLSRRTARLAHLGRCDGGDRRPRGVAALARLGVRCRGARVRAGAGGGVSAMVKVLISDKLSPAAVEIFRRRGIEVDVQPGLTPADLRAIIAPYDGLAVRSATKVTKELLDAATNLKVVGRAG